MPNPPTLPFLASIKPVSFHTSISRPTPKAFTLILAAINSEVINLLLYLSNNSTIRTATANLELFILIITYSNVT